MRLRKECIVDEDEFIGPVSGSVAFAVTSYPINPGQIGTFPWLYKQAAQWEKYSFDYIEFYYKRTVSEFATNGTTGKVIMSVDFDASDPPPTTKQQMEDTDPHADFMPSTNGSLLLFRRNLHSLYPKLYVRPGGLPGASDIKTYDAGIFHIATQGNQDTSEVGELRVRYRVKFEIPVLDSLTSVPKNYSVAEFSDASISLVSTVAKTIPFATELFNGISAVNAAGQITLPTGRYLVWSHGNVVFGGSGTAVNFAVLKNGSNITSNVYPEEIFSAASRTAISQSQMGYVEMNGADYISVQWNATFSTSTATVKAVLCIQLV